MARPTGFVKWCQTIKVGELVGATNARSPNAHIIRKSYHKTKVNSRNGVEDWTMVGGQALCGTRGEGWFWSILSLGDPEVFEEGSDCKYCFRRFRNLETPKIRNFVREGAKNAVDDDEHLPFGWIRQQNEKEPQRTEMNYGKDHVIFEQVSIWKRGPRLVTIGKVTFRTSGEGYPMLTARKWVEEKKWDADLWCSTMEQAIKSAYDTMAEGGY